MAKLDSRWWLINEDYKLISRQGNPSKMGILSSFCRNRGFRAIFVYRMRYYHKRAGNHIRYRMWVFIDQLVNKYIDIGDNTNIGPGFRIIHPYGIIIRAKTIGINCTLYQNVTIGANYRKDIFGNEYPVFGDNVRVGPGAVVVGPIMVGSNVVIGANSVVTKDVESECIVGGIPARLLSKYDKIRFT